ncbi:MAG: hypothetical protein HY706_03800 [Candidatus Hydrogenedentes bacterium]|nr:hypothetical protein [Candidatus Hydrogenedentota bacterium]
MLWYDLAVLGFSREKTPRIVLGLKADRVGMAFGGLSAVIVMTLSFYQGADPFVVVTRVLLGFLVAYAATAFFTLILVRTTAWELARARRERMRQSQQSSGPSTRGSEPKS